MAAIATFLCTSGAAFGQSIPAKCHQLYELFRATETYEDAGMVAEKMDNERCWPAVQAGPAVREPETSQLPAITNCETLAPHIVQMTEDQASTGNPVILRLYDAKPFTQATLVQVMTKGLQQGYRMQEIQDWFSKPVTGTTRVLDCTASARFQSSQDLIHFYLDRDPDGQEFHGYVAVMTL